MGRIFRLLFTRWPIVTGFIATAALGPLTWYQSYSRGTLIWQAVLANVIMFGSVRWLLRFLAGIHRGEYLNHDIKIRFGIAVLSLIGVIFAIGTVVNRMLDEVESTYGKAAVVMSVLCVGGLFEAFARYFRSPLRIQPKENESVEPKATIERSEAVSELLVDESGFPEEEFEVEMIPPSKPGELTTYTFRSRRRRF